MRFIAMICATSLLVACSSGANVSVEPSSTPTVEASSVVIDDKAMYAAEALYNVVAQAYVVADANKQLNSETKAKIKPYMIEAYSALKAAREAKRIGDIEVFTQQSARLQDYLGYAKMLLPKHKGT